MTRAPRRWWNVFALTTVLPAVVLGILALRAVRLAQMEARETAQVEHRQSAAAADTVLPAVLSGLGRRGDPRFTPYHVEPGGMIVFRRDRVYFGEFGARPKNLAPLSAAALDLVERARSATDPTFYRAVGRAEPALGPWANWSITKLERTKFEELNLGGALTPSGLPLALVVAADGQNAGRTLKKLRAGEWWLSYDERAFHDAELSRISGASSDSRLEDLAQIDRLLRRALPHLNGDNPNAFVAEGAQGYLFVRSATDPAQGLAVPAMAIGGLVEVPLRSVLRGAAEYAVLRDAHSGTVLWRALPGKGQPEHAIALASVANWDLAFHGASVERTLWNQQLLWYGFIGLLMFMLASGLAMTVHVVRRESNLAKRQSEFLSAITHEFKSPITSIRLLLEVLTKRAPATPETAAEIYGAIGQETTRLDRLVSRILASQRAEARNAAPARRPCDLGQLLEASVARFAAQAEAKRIELRSGNLGELTIPADAVLLGEAVDNLIDNAIRYSGDGTSILVALRASADHAVIEVCDHGIGIDDADIPNLFDPFFRGRRGDQYNVHGTGLGLSLVKAAAEAHAGTVEVETAPGEGSKFRMRLPLQEGGR